MNPKVVSIAAVGKSNDLPTASFSNTNAEIDYAGIGVDVISFKAESTDYKSMNGNYLLMICFTFLSFPIILFESSN